MLVDHDKKFVFIHVPKTAGTSLTMVLGHPNRPSNPHSVEDNILENYANYFRFCFVRNPWDRIYSSFNYALKMSSKGIIKGDKVRLFLQENPDVLFENFLMDWLDEDVVRGSGHFRPQIVWISKSSPQFIGRFETLENDTAYIIRALGLKNIKLAHRNKSSSGKSYRTIYTKDMINKVRSFYDRDIKFLGYEF